MSVEIKIIIALSFLVILFFYLWRKTRDHAADIKFQKHSLSSKYGKMTEQFLPFLADYPYNPQNFRFLGTPIDGIQFDEDKIIFLEFKTADAQLSQKQRYIRDLVKDGRITFEQIRLR